MVATRAPRRVVAVACTVAVLAAACGSPATPMVDAPDRSSTSDLVAVAEAELERSGLTGPFYEFTLVDHEGTEPKDAYDHTSFLLDDAEVVYTAVVEDQLQGETEWDRVEVVRYPDPNSYLETLASPEYAEAEAARSATAANTHVALTEPVTPISGDPLVAGQEPELGMLPTASDDPDDPPFILVAAVEVVDQTALDRHYEGAVGGGADAGVRPLRWMDVSATLVDSGEVIHSIRFNYWPSHSGFEQVIASDPDTSDREDGLGASSTMMTLPEVNTFTRQPGEAVELDLTGQEEAALYTPAAMSLLEATVGFSKCLTEAGQPWMGEPEPDDSDVDPAYLAALTTCAGELDVEEALVQLFAEAPDVAPMADVPAEYTSAAAVGGLVAVDGFVSCLDEAGFAWMGLPGDGAGSASYRAALSDCSGQSGIQAALDAMLAG